MKMLAKKLSSKTFKQVKPLKTAKVQVLRFIQKDNPHKTSNYRPIFIVHASISKILIPILKYT